MIHRVLFLFILLLASFNLLGQAKKSDLYIQQIVNNLPDSLTHATDDLAEFINIKFDHPKDKIIALLYWMSNNLTYDIDNRFSIELSPDNRNNKCDLLSERKGLCEDFVTFFIEITSKMGIKSYFIEGYAKDHNRIVIDMHAWCASEIESQWYLTDPTWAIGYVDNDNYIKKISSNYILIEPKAFIKHHMPMDPMWQLLNYQFSKEDFENGVFSKNEDKEYFDFKYQIRQYESNTDIQNLLSSFARIKENKVVNYLDYIYLREIKTKINDHFININNEKYNKALTDYEEGILLYHQYVEYKNNYYLPYKSDAEVEQMLIDIDVRFKSSLELLATIEPYTLELKTKTNSLKRLVDNSINEIKNQKEKLRHYFEIAKEYREHLSKGVESN